MVSTESPYKAHWSKMDKLSLILFGVVMLWIFGFFLFLIVSQPTPLSRLPLAANPTYRSVENTGGIFGGRAQYYIFDQNGKRYYVTQQLFDSYKDLPRE